MFKYDTEGSLHRSLTREKIVTVYEYDYLRRPIYEELSTTGETGVSSFFMSRSRHYNGFRCLGEKEDDHIKSYTFDPAGRLASILEYASGKKDSESRLTELFYDPFGRLHRRKVWFDSGTQDYALECFEYDLSGNMIEKRIEDSKAIFT